MVLSFAVSSSWLGGAIAFRHPGWQWQMSVTGTAIARSNAKPFTSWPEIKEDEKRAESYISLQAHIPNGLGISHDDPALI